MIVMMVRIVMPGMQLWYTTAGLADHLVEPELPPLSKPLVFHAEDGAQGLLYAKEVPPKPVVLICTFLPWA